VWGIPELAVWAGKKRDSLDQMSAQKMANDSDSSVQSKARGEELAAKTKAELKKIGAAKLW